MLASGDSADTMPGLSELERPQRGEISLCERNLEVISVRDGQWKGHIDKVRKIVDVAQFIPVSDIVITHGEKPSSRQQHSVLRRSSEADDKGVVADVLQRVADTYSSTLDRISSKFRPQPPEPHTCPLVKRVAWHRYLQVVAIAYSAPDGLGCVRVYSFEPKGTDWHWEEPIELHSPFMRDITCMEWRPFSASQLAVACKDGVLLWDVRYGSASYLRDSQQRTVTSLSFSPCGRSLATASSTSPVLLVWDLATQRADAFRRTGYLGISVVRWSPNGAYLFTAHPSGGFRVWETSKWNVAAWATVSTRSKDERPVVDAVWSSEGRVLLFALEGECVIYTLRFTQAPYSLDADCHVLTDMGLGEATIQQLVWDGYDQRLAVSFKERRDVALLSTRVDTKNIQYNPNVVRADYIGWLTGAPRLEHAEVAGMTVSGCLEIGSLLAVCWEGLVSDTKRAAKLHLIPLFFRDSSAVSEA